jgi:hypothetical protein
MALVLPFWRLPRFAFTSDQWIQSPAASDRFHIQSEPQISQNNTDAEPQTPNLEPKTPNPEPQTGFA